MSLAQLKKELAAIRMRVTSTARDAQQFGAVVDQLTKIQSELDAVAARVVELERMPRGDRLRKSEERVANLEAVCRKILELRSREANGYSSGDEQAAYRTLTFVLNQS